MIKYAQSKKKTDGPVGKAHYADLAEKTEYTWNVHPSDFFNLDYTLQEDVVKYLAKAMKVKLQPGDYKKYMNTKDPFKRYNDLFGDAWKNQLYKFAKKKGYNWSDTRFGGNPMQVYAVKDESYKSPKTFKERVNDGKKVRKIIHTGRISGGIDRIMKDYKLLTKKGTPSKVLNASLNKVVKAKDIPLENKLIVQSVNKKAEISPERGRMSLEQGLRFGLIEKDRQEYAGKEKYARLLSTTAKEPDLDHALLEGVIRPLNDVLNDLMRPGCQHDYEIVELKGENT